MSAMTPLEAAFVSEALAAVDDNAHHIHIRDGHSEYWGAEQLAMKLENMHHKVEWVYTDTKSEWHEDAETGESTMNIQKIGGVQAGWDDGFLMTRCNNINGLRMKHAVAGCHVKLGLTPNTGDSSMYEQGFFLGLYDEKKVVRCEKGKKEITCAKYEMKDRFTVQIDNTTGSPSVTAKRNDEKESFDVIGECKKEGTSMYGMIHIKERDAIGQLEEVFAIAMVTDIDMNGNLLTDAGVDRLSQGLEVPFTKVIDLDLGLNRIRDVGACRLSKVFLKPTCVIRKLVLSNNEIGDEGAAGLAEPLKTGCLLEKLWLDGNQIGDEGAMKLAEALETEECQLRLLELAWNNIEDEGAQRVIQALSNENCKVTHFSLDRNKWGEKKTKKMMAMILAKVPRFLDMSCGLTDDYPPHPRAYREPGTEDKEEEEDD